MPLEIQSLSLVPVQEAHAAALGDAERRLADAISSHQAVDKAAADRASAALEGLKTELATLRATHGPSLSRAEAAGRAAGREELESALKAVSAEADAARQRYALDMTALQVCVPPGRLVEFFDVAGQLRFNCCTELSASPHILSILLG